MSVVEIYNSIELFGIVFIVYGTYTIFKANNSNLSLVAFLQKIWRYSQNTSTNVKQTVSGSGSFDWGARTNKLNIPSNLGIGYDRGE